MEAKVFKTPCQTEREARDLAIYNEYNDLMSVKGQSKTLVAEHLMKNTASTVSARYTLSAAGLRNA